MDGGRAGLLASRFLQHGPDAVLKEICRRSSGTQVGTPMYGIFAPGTYSRIPASAQAGAMRASSFRGPRGCNPETRGSSSRTGTRWRNTSQRSRQPIPTFCGRRIPAFPLATGSLPRARRSSHLVATAYWAYDVTLMQQMAHALGKADDEKKVCRPLQQDQAGVYAENLFMPTASSPGPTIVLRHSDRSTIPTRRQRRRYADRLCARAEYESGARSLRAAAADKLVAKIQKNNWRWVPDFWVLLICWQCW